jgi:hypothetical protein
MPCVTTCRVATRMHRVATRCAFSRKAASFALSCSSTLPPVSITMYLVQHGAAARCAVLQRCRAVLQRTTGGSHRRSCRTCSTGHCGDPRQYRGYTNARTGTAHARTRSRTRTHAHERARAAHTLYRLVSRRAGPRVLVRRTSGTARSAGPCMAAGAPRQARATHGRGTPRQTGSRSAPPANARGCARACV